MSKDCASVQRPRLHIRAVGSGAPSQVDREPIRLADKAVAPIAVVLDGPPLGIPAIARPLLDIRPGNNVPVVDVKHLARLEAGYRVEAVIAALEAELLVCGPRSSPYLQVGAIRRRGVRDVQHRGRIGLGSTV